MSTPIQESMLRSMRVSCILDELQALTCSYWKYRAVIDALRERLHAAIHAHCEGTVVLMNGYYHAPTCAILSSDYFDDEDKIVMKVPFEQFHYANKPARCCMYLCPVPTLAVQDPWLNFKTRRI
jgi:hypothetical protein